MTPVRRAQQLGDGLGAALGLLVEPADVGVGRSEPDTARVGGERPGAHRQQGRLADAVGADQTDPAARGQQQLDVVEQTPVRHG